MFFVFYTHAHTHTHIYIYIRGTTRLVGFEGKPKGNVFSVGHPPFCLVSKGNPKGKSTILGFPLKKDTCIGLMWI